MSVPFHLYRRITILIHRPTLTSRFFFITRHLRAAALHLTLRLSPKPICIKIVSLFQFFTVTQLAPSPKAWSNCSELSPISDSHIAPKTDSNRHALSPISEFIEGELSPFCFTVSGRKHNRIFIRFIPAYTHAHRIHHRHIHRKPLHLHRFAPSCPYPFSGLLL